MMGKASLRRLSVAVAIGLFVACVCGTAQAALLWYDGIDTTVDYTVGQNNLAGQSGGGGTFFQNPWLNSTSWAVEHSVCGNSLVRPGQIHSSIGGCISDTENTAYPEYVARNFRAFTTPWGGFTSPVGTYYMGFLASWGKGPVLHHRALEMYDTDIGNDAYRTLQLGYSEWTGLGTGLSLSVADSSYAQTVDTLDWDPSTPDPNCVNFLRDVGTVHFMVLKFEMNESDYDPLTTGDNDVISVYLDPVGVIEPALPNAQISVDDFLASHMAAITQFCWGSGPETSTKMDELRVSDNSDGNGFADVANNTMPYFDQPWVPEPTSAVLLGLGLLGLLAVRRK